MFNMVGDRARIRYFEGHLFQDNWAKAPTPFTAEECLETIVGHEGLSTASRGYGLGGLELLIQLKHYTVFIFEYFKSVNFTNNYY